MILSYSGTDASAIAWESDLYASGLDDWMRERTKASAVLVALDPVARVGISTELTIPSNPSNICVS